MVTSAGFLHEDLDTARQQAVEARLNYVQSNTFRYHDTFPHPEAVPYWPELIPDLDLEAVQTMADVGAAIVGDPEQVAAKLQRYIDLGMDAFVLSGYPHLDECRRVGRSVLPLLDHGPLVL